MVKHFNKIKDFLYIFVLTDKLIVMKKILLSLLFVSGAYFVHSQSEFVQVLYPTNMIASYDHDFADWALTPDMTVPANKVVAPVIIARGTTTDSLMCDATTMDLTGKIALLFRGSCEFGLKAKNAFDAGAAGVIVVNNTTGLISMGAGNDGNVVSIPVVSILQSDGLLLRNALAQGDSVSVLLGNKIGLFGNDLGSLPGYTANVPAQAPVEIAHNTTEFPIAFAAQVYNYGQNNATNLKVKAEIFKNGSSLYVDTSSVIANLAAGDSTDAFTFTDYSGALGAGDYSIEYTFLSDSVDQSSSDNHFVYPFKINNDMRFSYAKYDYDSSFTFNSGNYGPSTRQGEFVSCITLQNPNADRLAFDGVYFQASKANDANGGHQSMEAQEVILTVQEWNDNFNYGVDPASFSNLVDVTSGSYVYDEDLSSQFVYGKFDTQVQLVNNKRYLVCLTTYDQQVYLGYDDATKYNFYQELQQRYLTPIRDGVSTWYAAGFVGNPVPSMTLEFIDPSTIGVAETQQLNGAKIYPNPAQNKVNIAVDNFEGNAELTVSDLSGRTILKNSVLVPSNGIVSFDSSTMTSGMYIVKMNLANGNQVKASLMIE